MNYEEIFEVGVEQQPMHGVGMGIEPITAAIGVISIAKKAGLLGGTIHLFAPENQTKQAIKSIRDIKTASKNIHLKKNQILSAMAKATKPYSDSNLQKDADAKIRAHDNASNDFQKGLARRPIIEALNKLVPEIEKKVDEVQDYESELQTFQINQQQQFLEEQRNAAEAQKRVLKQQRQAQQRAQTQYNSPAKVSSMYASGKGGNTLMAGNNKIFVIALALLAAGSLVWGLSDPMLEAENTKNSKS